MSNKSPNLIKVAAIQMSCIPHDKEANVENALRHIEATSKSGAKLLVLPEIFTMGYHCLTERNTKYFDEAEPIPGPTTRAIGAKAKEYGVYVVTPIFERAGPGNYYNTAALIGPEGNVVGKYSKTHIPLSGGGALEKYYFRPGSEFPVFETEYGKVGIIICYDRLFPEPFRILAIKGADIVLVPATIFPRPEPTVSEDWNFVARTRAVENGVFAVFVNRSGEEGGRKYFGHSLIVNPDGVILSQAGFEEGVVTAEIDLNQVDAVRRRRVYARDRRPEIYSKLIETR